MRPGTNVTALNSPPDATPVVDTGTWFAAGITSQGPTGAQLVTSMNQFQQVFGSRGSNPIFWDSADIYFKEQGARMYVSRVVGPAAQAASVSINDSSSAPALKVYAEGPGAYANGYKVVVTVSGSTYTMQVQDSSGNPLETSNNLTTNIDAVGYGQQSAYVMVVSLGANPPASGTYTLAGGADDIANANDTQHVNALNVFTADLGPGQESLPGRTSTAAITGLFNHANSFGGQRVAIADLPDVNTNQLSSTAGSVMPTTSSAAAATLTTAGSPITGLGTVARAGGMFTPWADVAPIPGSIALRPVPPSPFVAARCAVVDQSGNPNVPAAGVNGVLSTVVQLHAVFADTDRQNLNNVGVNVIRKVYNSFRVYGFRTAVNPVTDPNYFMLNNARLDMAILALAAVIQEDYVFSQIDGNGLDAARYGNALKAMLEGFYGMGALYGGSSAEAYSVDTGDDVNTPASEATGTLAATIAVRRSPEAEQVNLNVVRVAITQAV